MGKFCGYWKGSKRLERKFAADFKEIPCLPRQSWNSKTRTFCA